MKKNNKLVGILLAGGLSRRYGSPKAFANINGKMFYEITYDVLENLCDEVVIVTREEYVDSFPRDYHVIVDREPFHSCGPLAGIYSAMEYMEADVYACLPCDMPLMNKQVMQRLIEFHDKDITVVVSDGQLHPLVSIWSKHMKAKIYQALRNENYKMTAVLDQAETIKIDEKRVTKLPHVFMNVNTPENDKELREWEKL